jgi:hypothetical protein
LQVSELYAPAEAKLRHMINSSAVQRWAMYEWHYSAIDRPYFMRSEMQVGRRELFQGWAKK